MAKKDSDNHANPTDQDDGQDVGQNSKRKKLFGLLGAAIVIAGVGYGAWWLMLGSRYVSTDNAYTAVEIAVVTPSVGGIVQSVSVVDTQAVKKGDVLVTLDDRDAKLALQQAEAELSRATRRVQGYMANDQSLKAQISQRAAEKSRVQAQVAQATADLQRTKIDLERRQKLVASGSVSAEEITNAETAYNVAKANLDAAQAAVMMTNAGRETAEGSQQANAALIKGTSLEENPEVLSARARRDQAALDLERTIVRASQDGVIARRSVQVGQRVQMGEMLMSLVPLQSMHVDANFKEGQLTKVAVGQSVKLTSDLYGGSVVYHGKVEGIAAGSGSVFAAIPAQNATGNWIKVVQRLPVRISLDPQELAAHPLKIGLSMSVEVDSKSQ